MWRLTLANAVTHRSRLALTWLAVALGVAFVAGSLTLTDTSNRLLDEQFRTATADIDITIRDAAAFDSAMGVEVQRDPLPMELVRRVTDAPGVRAARPAVSGQALLEVRGKAITPTGPTMLGTWAEKPFSAYTLRSGRPPKDDGEVVVDAATAAEYGIQLGDAVRLVATSTVTARVVGITAVGDRDGLPNTTIALVNLATAQRLVDLDGITHVDVVAEPGRPVEQLRSSLAELLGSDYAVTSSQDTADASAAAAKQSLDYLRVVLLVLAAAGLVVGAFLIANTFSIVLTQRSRELALLRAAGATGRQVFVSVVGEAALVGASGAVAGTALGVAAAVGLRDAARGLGLALPDSGLVVEPRTLAVAVAAGAVVTLVAAIAPARRASRIAPVEAMRQSAVATAPTGRGRRWTGWALLALGGAQLAGASVSRDIAGVALGAALFLISLVVLGPVFAPRLAHVIGRPLDGAGVPGRLARESAARAPRRTSATAMAFALGLALITFMSVLATSLKASIGNSYREVITADYVIESGRNEMLGGLSPAIARRIAGLPQVARTSVTRYGHWKDGQLTSALTAIDPRTIGSVANITMVSGSLDALDTGGVVIARHVADDRGLAVGDELPMTFARTATQRLRVVGVIDDNNAKALSTDYLISLDTYAKQFSERVDASVFLALAAGVTTDEARPVIDAALADYPTAEVRDQAAAVAGRAVMIDQILGLVTVLLMFAVMIALLGITNTLALSIVERTREIGLLRAVGTTRPQIRWMVRGEAVLVSVLAIALGVGVGLALAASTIAALGASTPVAVVIPSAQLVAIVGSAVIAGLVAGMLPARRAARLDVLTAIATH